MNHLPKCLYGILAIVCFASCSKNSDADPAPTDDPAQQDTLVVKQQDTLLSKAIVWDSADLGATAYTWEYVFDDQKRVKVRVVYDSDTNGVKLPAAKTDTSLQFFYTGAEKNASSTFGWTLFWDSKTEPILHFYNSNNQVIKDSIKNGSFYRTRTYTYLPDKLITYDYTITGILPPGHTRDTFQIVNNNIASGKFAMEPMIGQDAFEMTYDNKINPLNKLNIATLELLEGGHAFSKGTYLSPGFCKNNITKRIGYWSKGIPPSSQPVATETYQYTYNELNLPVYCKKTSTIYNSSAGRMKYVYTH